MNAWLTAPVRGCAALLASSLLLEGCSLVLSFDDLASDDTSAGTSDGGTETGANGELPVNCLDPSLITDPKCIPVHHGTPGSVGAGIVLPWDPGEANLGGGFVESQRIVLAVVGADDDGALMGVDLASGDRSVLSGRILDAASVLHERGVGPSLAHVADVGRAEDGAWLALTFTLPQQIIRVDPTSGDRSLWHSWSSMTCARPDAGGAPIEVIPPNGTEAKFETAPDGTVYLPIENTAEQGYGIARWREGTCTMVSFHSNVSPELSVGSGPSMLWMISDLRVSGDSLYVVGGGTPALVRVDLATGDRFIVSRSDSPQVGAGSGRVGRDSIAPATDRVWTLGPLDGVLFVLSEVDPATGERVGHDGMNGAVFDVYASRPQVWVHPSRPLLILELRNGLVLYDPATDNNNLLSY